MTKKELKKLAETEKRKETFNSFYQKIYKDKWDDLKELLLKESSTIEYSEGLLQPYFLDEASIAVAKLLPLKEGDNILDMCAAPGGKTLVIASHMSNTSTLCSNDRSKDRKIRLDKVIEDHLPKEIKERVTTTNYNAALTGQRTKIKYDAVLLDAPCSSERHVLQSEKHLSMWSESRPKRLEIEQFGLLSSAFDAVKVGGFILYSTCSINMGENIGVIDKLIERRSGLVEEVKFDLPSSTELKHGRIILPTPENNAGPLFACLLRKLGEREAKA